jgi:hypothetical protein
LLDPGACRNDEPIRVVAASFCSYSDAGRMRLPIQNSFPYTHACTARLSQHDIRRDASLGQEKSSVRLENGEGVHRKSVTRKALCQLGRCEDFVRQVMQLAGLSGSFTPSPLPRWSSKMRFAGRPIREHGTRPYCIARVKPLLTTCGSGRARCRSSRRSNPCSLHLGCS